MAAKKMSVGDDMTKAELIKALRASVAREAKLHKQVAKLQELLREVPVPLDDAGAAGQEDATSEPAQLNRRFGKAEGKPPALHPDNARAVAEHVNEIFGPEHPAFPWEKK